MKAGKKLASDATATVSKLVKKKIGPKQPAPAKQEAAEAPARKRARASSEDEPDAPASARKLAKKSKPAKKTETDKVAKLKTEAAPAPPAAVVTVPTKLDVAQVGCSVRALLAHVARERGGSSLLDDDGAAPVNVLLATKHVPKAVGKARACKPVSLSLPHPFVTLDTAEICLITKDPHKEYKEKLAAEGLRAKVLGVSSLKKKYHPYQAKRELLKAHEVFLADARVLPMLPPLLGKTFFTKRRLPVAVDLAKKDLRAELTRAACGALYRHSAGTSNSMQLGTSEQPEAHLVANIVAGVEQAVSRIPGKWDAIQSLQLRTTNSVALPFYNSLPHQR